MNFFAAEIARKIGYKYTNFAEEYQKFYGESLEKHQEKLSPSDCKKLQEYLM
jgi:hypothetical protein